MITPSHRYRSATNSCRGSPGARKDLGLAPDLRYIRIVATLRSWKGHHYLIDACRQITRHDWRLLIIGDGPRRDYLREMVARLELGERVRLLGQRDDRNAGCRPSMVFCLPSTPTKACRSAAPGHASPAYPIVDHPVGSITEALEAREKRADRLRRECAALAHAIQRLLDEPELGARLCAAARATALARYTGSPCSTPCSRFSKGCTHAH